MPPPAHRDALRAVAEGFTNAEIAEELGLASAARWGGAVGVRGPPARAARAGRGAPSLGPASAGAVVASRMVSMATKQENDETRSPSR